MLLLALKCGILGIFVVSRQMAIDLACFEFDALVYFTSLLPEVLTTDCLDVEIVLDDCRRGGGAEAGLSLLRGAEREIGGKLDLLDADVHGLVV